MKLKFNFAAPIDEAAARKRITGFFEQVGYTTVSSSATDLEFKRGLRRGMFFSFDPYNWECRAKVLICGPDGADKSDGSDVLVEYAVSNDPLEHSLSKEIWTDEFRRLQTYVLTGEIPPFDKTEPKRKVTGYVLDIVGIFYGILIILLAAALVLSYRLTDTRPPMALIIIDGLIIAGGVVFVGWRLWRIFKNYNKK